MCVDNLLYGGVVVIVGGCEWCSAAGLPILFLHQFAPWHGGGSLALRCGEFIGETPFLKLLLNGIHSVVGIGRIGTDLSGS